MVIETKAGCPVCKGAGIVHPRRLDGSPDYSKTMACPYPGCMGESARDFQKTEDATRRWQESGVIQRQTFENFKLVRGTEVALKYAKELAFGTANFGWLGICGGVGNGKTHLCNAIARVSLERGMEVIMLSSANMFSKIKSAMNDNTDQELIKRLKEVMVLVIDDLGAEYDSPWQLSILDEILDTRYHTARLTVVASNLDLQNLPESMKRIESRFADKNISRVAFNSAPDYRKR